MSIRESIVTILFVTLSLTPFSSRAQQASPSGAAKKYLLQYKLQAGEELVSRVVHFAETRTTMAEHEEASSSRTTSEKVWDVQSVNDKGEMTFEYRINAVNMAQSVGDAEELTYNSETDSNVPDVFKNVAATIAKPLDTVTINPQGQIVSRNNDAKMPQMGIGELTIPLPAEPVGIDGQWSVPRELRVKLESGAFKTIKVRELYTLEKVSAGVATIRIVTQPLTPVNDPAIDAQLIQQLSKGEIKFDLDRGRLISKVLDWNEEVVGFKGADTSLRYNAKFNEELLPTSKRTASRTGTSSK